MKDIVRGNPLQINMRLTQSQILATLQNISMAIVSAMGRKKALALFPHETKPDTLQTIISTDDMEPGIYGLEVVWKVSAEARRSFRRKAIHIVEADEDARLSEVQVDMLALNAALIFTPTFEDNDTYETVQPEPQPAQQVQSDWDEQDETCPAFIRNKPFGIFPAAPDAQATLSRLGYTPDGLEHGEGTRLDIASWCVGVFAWPHELGTFDPGKTYLFRPIVNMEIENVCTVQHDGTLEIVDNYNLASYILTGQKFPDYPEPTEYGYDEETGEWDTEEHATEYDDVCMAIEEQFMSSMAAALGVTYPLVSDYDRDPETDDLPDEYYDSQDAFWVVCDAYIENLYDRLSSNGGWLPQLSKYDDMEMQPEPFAGYSAGRYYPDTYRLYTTTGGGNTIDLLYVPAANCIVVVSTSEAATENVMGLAYHPDMVVRQLPDEFIPELLWDGLKEAREKSQTAVRRLSEKTSSPNLLVVGSGTAANPYKLRFVYYDGIEPYTHAFDIPLAELAVKLISPAGVQLLAGNSELATLRQQMRDELSAVTLLRRQAAMARQTRVYEFTWEEWTRKYSGPVNYNVYWCPNPAYGLNIPQADMQFAAAAPDTPAESLFFEPIPADRPVQEYATSGGIWQMDISADGRYIRIKPNGSPVFDSPKSIYVKVTGVQPVGTEFLAGLISRIETLESQINGSEQ